MREKGKSSRSTHLENAVERKGPVPNREGFDTADTVWAEMDDLAAEISARWPAERSAVDAVAEQRR